jgi:drug/metabolite transporter (DMT)-like permease
MRLLKCWVAGLAFSLIVVAGEAFALHTPFGFLAILLGIPMLILNAIATGSHRPADSVVYALLAFFGSIFYGLLFYLISALIRRISSQKPPPMRS